MLYFILLFVCIHASDTTYGTITPQCLDDIITTFDLNREDRVVDLGSGIGNVCTYLSPYVKKCSGYEIVKDRYDQSVQMKRPNTDFFLKDFTSLEMFDFEVVFMHSTMFSNILIEKTRNILLRSSAVRLIFSQKAIFDFGVRSRFKCKFSWSGSTDTELYVYIK